MTSLNMFLLERTTLLDAPLEDVFEFFSDAENLSRITPPWLAFRIEGTAPPMEEGARIEYRIRWAFVSLRWVTRITRFSPPREFQDVQERGPYAVWIHTHTFVRDGGRVRMRDRVEYSLPFGLLGRIAHALLVRRQLEAIFDFRESAVAEIFGRVSGGSSQSSGERLKSE